MRSAFFPVILLLAACADHAPLGPTAPAAAPAADRGAAALQAGAAVAAIVDISGAWSQQREVFIHLVEWAAPMFGVTPEGARTTLRCSVDGTVDIVQDGAAFTATYAETGTCSTPGGQSVSVASAGTMQGTISGRSVDMIAYGEPGPVACPQRGAIRVENGVAVEIGGMGHCIEPGHPRSLVDVPAPRAGPNLTRWVFRR
jgi:hypothetical protein